jgi:multisubunit Na+/H+ antiporter MnhG subunit
VTLGDVIVAALLVLGVAVQVVCFAGMLVMRNVFDRLHYVAPASFGAVLIAAAVVARESFSLIGDKALALAALLVVSGALLVHVTARTARIRTAGDWMIRDGERIEVEER